MANLKLKIDTSGVKKGEQEFSRSANNIINSASKIATKTRAATAAFRAFGVVLASGIVYKGFKTVISEAIEAERVMAQLEAVIQSTGGVAGFTAEELDKTASSLQKVSTFGDEAIKSAQALLLTFKQIKGEEFDRATIAILDLAIAMGTDLQSAVIQVGKALNDPVANLGALSRAGIQFEEQQKNLIKTLFETGNVAEAQRIILKELESQFGGSAAAARDTLGGALTNLQNTLSDLSEAIGTSISGESGLKGFVEAVNDIVEKSIKPLANAVNIISISVSTAINLVYGTAETILSATEGLGVTVASVFFGIANAIPDAFRTAFNTVLTGTTAFLATLAELIAIGTEKAISFITTPFETLAKKLEESNIFGTSAIASGLKTITAGINFIDPTEEVKKISDNLRQIAINSANDTENAWNSTKENISLSFEAIKTVGSGSWLDVKNTAIENFNAVKFNLDDFFETYESNTEKSTETVKKNVQQQKEQYESLGDTIKNITAESASSFTSAFADAIMGVESAFDDFFKGLLKKILEAQIQQSITQPLFAGLGLPGFANGGITPVNQPFIVGERGPEIMQLGQPATVTPNLGGSTNVTVINNTNSQAQVTESENSQGGKDITVIIDEVVAGSIANGGKSQKAISAVFGLNTRGY